MGYLIAPRSPLDYFASSLAITTTASGVDEIEFNKRVKLGLDRTCLPKLKTLMEVSPKAKMAYLLAMTRRTSEMMPSLLSSTTSVWPEPTVGDGATVEIGRAAKGCYPTITEDLSTAGDTGEAITTS